MKHYDKNKYIFGFSLIEKFGPASFRKIADFFSSFEDAWNCQSQEKFIKTGITKKTTDFILKKKQKINLDLEWDKMNKEGIKMISIEDNFYPKQLKDIHSSPFVIFYKGNIELLKKKQLAIVGSRKPTFYGKQTLEKIIPSLIQSGLVITSGMALGIDSLAHEKTLENQGKTIAVLGSGLGQSNIKYKNFQLFNKIINNEGLVISEYPPNYPANKFTFPARNRIISGLSLGVLVIEAAEKSGTLITANYALQQNREVFAVPGNIFSAQSAGTHQLIQQGAKLVSEVDDIFEELNFISNSNPNSKKKNFENETEEAIYNFLTFEPTHIDKIAKKFKLSSAQMSQYLSLMELQGLIKSIPGNKFVRN